MKKQIDSKELQKRTRRGFIFFSISILSGIFSFAWMKSSEEVDELPGFFRKIHEWNGALWRSLFNPAKNSDHFHKPIVGTEFRMNGDEGLSNVLDVASWRLTNVCEGKYPESRPLVLTMTDLLKIPKTESVCDFKCIEGWSEVVAYGGVKFSDFMNHFQLGKKPNGSWYRYVSLETPDAEYYVSIDIESMLHSQTVLTYELNGKPLSHDNGAPLRLMIPVKYGIKNIKQIGKIAFSDTRPPDYWAERGYDWYSGL